MKIKSNKYSDIKELLMELHQIRDYRPVNMWSFSDNQKYLIEKRLNRKFERCYNKLKRLVQSKYSNDPKLEQFVNRMPNVFFLIGNRCEIISFTLFPILFFSVYYLIEAFDMKIGVTIENRGGETDIIETIIIGFAIFPLGFWCYGSFFSTIENQVDKIDKLLSEFDFVCRKA